MTWWIILSMTAGAYAFKALGIFGLSRVDLRGPLADLVRFLPAAMLAGLIMQQTLSEAPGEIIATRALGIAAGGIAIWAKAPLIVVIVVSAGVAALARLAV